MSDLSTFPSEGIRHVIIEQMARDAVVEGLPVHSTIDAACLPTQGATGPSLSVEGEAARISGVAVTRLTVQADMAVTVKNSWGDLRVSGLSADLNLESVCGSLRLLGLSGVVRVAQVDADLRAHGVADLRLMGNCNGDLRVDDGEHFAAESVAGDVSIHNLSDARLGRVRGDLWADKVRGALQVTRVDGDARLTEIEGAVTLKAIAADLRAYGLTGGLSAAQVNGDAVLRPPYSAANPYAVSALGDVVLHLPANADARIAMRASGRIRSDAPLTPGPNGSTSFVTLGKGTTHISLTSGGDLRIVQGGGKEHGKTRPTPPREPKPPRPPWGERPRTAHATTEEQIAVLKMVEQGAITPAEAEMLLKALGA
jgi:hypothetical protein